MGVIGSVCIRGNLMTLFFPDLEAKYRREERAKIRAAMSEWYARQQDALRKGEPFDEPLPLVDDEDGDVNRSRYWAQLGRNLMTLFLPDLEAKYRKDERAKQEAKRRTERTAERTANRAWYARLQEAERKGEPFDEPPPWVDDEEGGDAGDGR